MRILPAACLAVLVVVAPAALSQTPPANADTYAALLQHGVVIVTPDLEIDVKFKSDGSYVALSGTWTGTWKIVGDQLCTTTSDTKIETCQAYPAGKKSGDAFDLYTPQGAVRVRIP